MPRNEWTLIGVGLTMGASVASTATAATGWPALIDSLEWETLATGITALIAAGMTVAIIWRQITESKRQSDDQRYRRERAARATLPVALSEMCEYALDCMALFSAAHNCFAPDGELIREKSKAILAEHPMPKVPDGPIKIIKECVEYADGEVAEALAILLIFLQVQNSRMNSNINALSGRGGQRLHCVTIPNIDQAILDSAEVYARSSVILEYARFGQFGKILPCASDVMTSLNLGPVDEFTHRNVFERAVRWAPADYCKPVSTKTGSRLVG